MRTEGKVRLIVLNALAQPECVARREEQARAACASLRSIPMLSCALAPTRWRRLPMSTRGLRFSLAQAQTRGVGSADGRDQPHLRECDDGARREGRRAPSDELRRLRSEEEEASRFPLRRSGDAMCGGRGAEPACVRPRPHGLCERARAPVAPRTLTCVFASWASWRGPQGAALSPCAGGPFLSCFSQRLRRGREQRLT